MSIMEIKAQAAIEYLTTYIWAILIIALVAVALYEFGIFNGSTTPSAQPGSCYVTRPYGPGTTIGISLTGECTGILPKFMVLFGTKGNYFFVSPSPETPGNTATEIAWIYVTAFSTTSLPRSDIVTTEGGGGPSGGAGLRLSINNYSNHEADFATWTTKTAAGNYVVATSSSGAIALNHWYFIAGAYNGVAISVWLNASLAGSTPSNYPINQRSYITGQNNMSIGSETNKAGGYFYGYISNVQIYNTSLSQSELWALYK